MFFIFFYFRTTESGWSNFVQDHGNLFYVETESTTPRNRRKHDVHLLKNRFRRDDKNEAEISDGVLLHQDFRNGRVSVKHGHYEHDDAIGESDSAYGSGHNSRQTSREKRTARLHLDVNKNSDKIHPEKVTQNDHSGSYHSTEVLSSEFRNSSSKERNSQSRSSGNFSYSPPITAGKRKSFHMVPNLQNVSNVLNLSGSVLCEKLFGIILCQYKHRSKPNGSNIDQVLRDRKLIVQAVVPDSQAHACGHIHRGKFCQQIHL